MLSTDTFLIRNATLRDLPQVMKLSSLAASPHFSRGREGIRRLLTDSETSFRGKLTAPESGRYLFLLEEEGSRRVLGLSLLIAKTGRPGSPHVFLTSFTEVRTSLTLGTSVKHRCLRLGSAEDGPTELSDILLLPCDARKRSFRTKALTLAPLLYMAAHADRFQTCVMAENPVPGAPKKGTNPFWESLGKEFTTLSFREALSAAAEGKEFLLSLFPRVTLYEKTLPAAALKTLAPGEKSPPEKSNLFFQTGFRFLQQINPINGNPYVGTLVREVSTVRAARQLQCFTLHTRPPGGLQLVLSDNKEGDVRVAAVPLRHQGTQTALSVEDARRLGLAPGDWFWTAPLPPEK